MPYRRRSRALRVVVVLLAVVVLAPVLTVLGAVVFVDPNAWRPQIAAAVEHATGRTLSFGRLSIVASLSPTLGATDLALANAPGGSRPDMVRVSRAEVKLALLPLLAGRVEITRLVLVQPDILLERDAAGRPNWNFAADPVAGASPASAAPPGAAPGVLLRALRIEGGSLTWAGRDGATPIRIDLRVLEAGAIGMEAPITFSAQATYAGQPLAMAGETGPLSRLLDNAANTPWPVKGTLETPGARLTATGGLTRPMAGEGFAFSVEGAAVNLSALDGFLATRLPPLRQVAFAARVVVSAGHLPELSGLAVRAGASDLDPLVTGLKLDHAELSAANLGEPVRLDVVGSLRGAPLRVTAALGPLAALLPNPPKPAPYPVEVAVEASGATLAVKGGIARPMRLSGIDLAVTGRIPDLSALSPLAGVELPALRPVTLDARVADREGMPGFTIRGLAVTAPEADVSGELAVGLASRPTLQATLSSRRIDLDAVLARPSASPAAAPLAASLPSQPRRLIPDGTLPLALLDVGDVDLRLSVGELRSAGAAYRDLSARLSLQDGKLVLDPFSGTLPGGRMELKLSLDSRPTPPPAALALHAPGLPLKPLFAALHLPDVIVGSADVDADLYGSGDTPRALAAGLGGRLGVAMTDGELDNALLGASVGGVLTAAPQLASEALGLGKPGRTRIRCLALRGDAEGGLVTVGTLVADTGKVVVNGAGTLNLRDEGMLLHLRPMLRAGASLVIPVRVGGTLTAPKFEPDAAGSLATVAGLAPRTSPLGLALAAMVANERSGDACGPALAAARKLPNPAAPLRGLLQR